MGYIASRCICVIDCVRAMYLLQQLCKVARHGGKCVSRLWVSVSTVVFPLAQEVTKENAFTSTSCKAPPNTTTQQQQQHTTEAKCVFQERSSEGARCRSIFFPPQNHQNVKITPQIYRSKQTCWSMCFSSDVYRSIPVLSIINNRSSCATGRGLLCALPRHAATVPLHASPTAGTPLVIRPR